ncbi:MAG: hypothetical protein HFI32_05315 [Lachnospiraceae bacterium]|nr:hypothetical protein [Lachnospiraceae bacterium]
MKHGEGLRHAYVSVEGSYGGSQSWSDRRIMSQSGCGVVAAGDVLLYLGLHHRGCRTERTHGLFYSDGRISRARYKQYMKGLLWYFPVLPYLGMPFWVLTTGLNRYFRKNGIHLRARWGVLPWNLKKRMGEMFRQDLPVILSIGPNFPPFFRKEKLKLYEKNENGGYVQGTQTRAHFVVATGFEGGMLRISSWGKCYYIDWKEYVEYLWKKSNACMTNICVLRPCAR